MNNSHYSIQEALIWRERSSKPAFWYSVGGVFFCLFLFFKKLWQHITLTVCHPVEAVLKPTLCSGTGHRRRSCRVWWASKLPPENKGWKENGCFAGEKKANSSSKPIRELCLKLFCRPRTQLFLSDPSLDIFRVSQSHEFKNECFFLNN